MIKWILAILFAIGLAAWAEAMPGTVTLTTAAWNVTVPDWLAVLLVLAAVLGVKLLFFLFQGLGRLTRREMRPQDYRRFMKALEAMLSGEYQQALRDFFKLRKRHPLCATLCDHADRLVNPVNQDDNKTRRFDAQPMALLMMLEGLLTHDDPRWQQALTQLKHKHDQVAWRLAINRLVLCDLPMAEHYHEDVDWGALLQELPADVALATVRELLHRPILRNCLMDLKKNATQSDLANKIIQICQSAQEENWTAAGKQLTALAENNTSDALLLLNAVDHGGHIKPAWLIARWQNEPENLLWARSLAIYYLRSEQWQSVVNVYARMEDLDANDHLNLAMANSKLGHQRQTETHLSQSERV